MSKLIARPRLIARVRAAVADHALTFLAAPLGGGKTAALELAFPQPRGVARLFAELWHRGAFVAALVDVVRTERAGFGRLTLGALAAGASQRRLGETFGWDLRHIDAPLIVAIDNAHVLYDDPGFAAFFEAFVPARPETVRFVFAGRALPLLDFSGAFARRDATVVGVEPFRFDRSEIAALARVLGRELDTDEISAVESATDGWAAAVVLAMLSSPGGVPSLRSVDAATAYLGAELLPSLAPSVVTFLETTAIFETLDVAVLERVDALGEARLTLERLLRDGALVTEVGAGIYRLHPILRELLRRRLVARDGEAAAHAMAVTAFVAAGAPAPALHHAMASDDPRVLGRFLRANALAATATGDRSRLRLAAARLDTTGDDADVAAFVRALDEKAAGSPDARVSFVRAAIETMRTGDVAIRFFARAQVVEHDLGRLRYVDADELADLRRTAHELGPDAVATAAMLGGWAAAVDLNFTAACACVVPFAARGDAGTRFNTDILLAYAQTALGAGAAAQATLDALLRSLENDDRIVLQTLALVWYGRLALAWGATDAAYDAATEAERLATALALGAEEAALFTLLTELATQRGDVVATITYAERARERAGSAWYVADVARTRAFADIALARAAFLNRDNALAHDLARRVAVHEQTPAPMRALAACEAALYAFLSAAPQAAAELADARAVTHRARAVDVNDAVALATAADLLEFLAAAAGDSPLERAAVSGPFDALVAGRRGLVTLELAGLAVANARAGRGSAEAIAIALERVTKDGPRFEARLARAYASSVVTGVKRLAAESPVYDLTEREREILVLLVDGLMNKEIAQRLRVSPRTVETHVERVLAKLDVGTRSRAIAKALRVGLVTLREVPNP